MISVRLNEYSMTCMQLVIVKLFLVLSPKPSRFSACNSEKLGIGPGDEAIYAYMAHI